MDVLGDLLRAAVVATQAVRRLQRRADRSGHPGRYERAIGPSYGPEIGYDKDMKKVAEKLTEDDMIAIAAYAASLPPQ